MAGGGGSAPSLTHSSSEYPPARLAIVLKTPTAGMKAAGMVPLTLSAADMNALVSYVNSLGVAPRVPPRRSPSPSGPSSLTPAKTPAGSSIDTAAAAQGKAIFDSHGCSGCHGVAGGGGSGPALTHTSSEYPPAKLTGVLKAPTAAMKAAGMAPLTLNPADMKALVSYVGSLGAVSAAPAAGSLSPVSLKAKPAPKKKGILNWLFAP